MDVKTLDTIAQVGITTFGVTAIHLVARKNKWGFVMGLCAQPFWYTTTYIHQQWWIMALSLVYTYNWYKGIRYWFSTEKVAPAA